MNSPGPARGAIVVTCLLVTSAYLTWMRRGDVPVSREPLSSLAVSFDGWTGSSAPVQQEVLRRLQVDDYVNREYVNGTRVPVTLYIGYYGGLRTGSGLGPHSPLLCLPGMGWELVDSRPLTIPLDANGAQRSIVVSRAIAQNGAGRLLVLFWYEVHGKAIPTEAASKVYLFVDAVRARRTDGALVRVVAPIGPTGSEGAAERATVSFVQSLYPRLGPYLPG